MARLGDICTVISGSTPKTSVEEYWDGDIKWITPAEINEDSFYITDTVRHITERGKCDTGLTVMPIGTVILSSRAPIGKTAIAGCEMCCNQGFKNLICSDKIYNEYLYFFLKGKTDFLNSLGRGATFKEISKSIVENIEVPLPNFEAQKQIALQMRQVESLIGLRKQQLSKLDELVKSRFIEMFGTIHANKFNYDTVTLQDVSEPIKDGTHQTPTYTEDAVNGFKFLSSKDVTTGTIDWSHLKYITEDLHKELYSRLAPRKGDILLAKNGTTGIAAIVDRDEIFDIYVSLALIRPLDINSVYLWAAINSTETKQQFDASLKGIGVPNLHLGEIKKAKIILPPTKLQVQFATFVEQIDKSKFEIQKSLEKLETLKKALMQKYFG
jgi:type I restriction enzyme S subunit